MLLLLAGILPKVFADDSIMDSEEQDDEALRRQGIVRSSHLLEDGKELSCQSLLVEAQAAYREDDIDHTLKLVKRAINLDDNDIEAHALYADALEKKLKRQPEKDPEMFQTCIKEWLLVLRNEVGEEKGLTAHGLGIPGLGKFYEDEDHSIKAKQHLYKLVGSLPKIWETDNKYLKRVLTPAATSVSGRVIKNRPLRNKDEEFLSK
jgi:hypothetical protein